ncbi:MAG: xanthine dehydrogenase family protein subunit M [Immundisolibacteraceae bacterium]|nr:xanthine dehydrogenase family protein subunit M [Immundisolibacteraceae bacterium]
MSEMIYSVPASLTEAVQQLAVPGAALLAGGTDLLIQLRGGRPVPPNLVDLKKIPELQLIEIGPDSIRIGAGVTGIQITDHAELTSLMPGFVEGVGLIGSTQVQGRATPIGNLCNGSPAADSVPAMIAADAVCEIIGREGSRELPVGDFLTGPGRHCLKVGEFVVALRFPRPRTNQSDAYLRFIPRTEMDLAVAGAAVNLILKNTDSGPIVADAKVVIGGVAPTALTVDDAAQALIGTSLDDAALLAAGAASTAAARPISDKRGTAQYRKKIVAVLTRRAAQVAFDRAAQQLHGSND